MNTKQPEALRIADDLRHSIVYYGRKDAFTLNAYDAEKRLRSLHAENETLRTCNDKAQHEIAALQERVQQFGQLEAVSADGMRTLMLAPAQDDDSLTAAYMAGAHDAKAAARAATPCAPVIEDEIRKQDEALIQLMLEALECSGEPDDPGHRCSHCDDYVDRNNVLRNAARKRLEAVGSIREETFN